MDIYDFKNALIIGFFMAFMIGPVFFMLIQTSILKGARAAIVFDLGVIIGDLTFILIAYYGSRPLLEKIKDDPRLFFIGGLVLVIYGLITYFNKENKKEALESAKIIEVPIKNNYLKLFLKGYFLNFINIGVLAFWLLGSMGFPISRQLEGYAKIPDQVAQMPPAHAPAQPLRYKAPPPQIILAKWKAPPECLRDREGNPLCNKPLCNFIGEL